MHSLVFVILPAKTGETFEDVNAELYELLCGSEAHPGRTFGYDQTLCHCHGWEARCEASRRVDESPEGVERLRALTEARTAQDEDTEERILAERRDIVAAFEKVHPLRAQPDPRCRTCNGSGTQRVSRDPLGKGDSFDVGGRWNRLFEDGPVPEDVVKDPLYGNVSPAKEIIERSPQAIVTPDGQWRERPFGLGEHSYLSEPERTSLKEWDDLRREILLRYSNHRVVVVDCHS